MLGEIGIASPEDISGAVHGAAGTEEEEWAKVPGPQRGDVLREFSRLILAHAREVADQLVRETGFDPCEIALEAAVNRAMGEYPYD
jgi:benzaldehyde dehydrogenase (NAD)